MKKSSVNLIFRGNKLKSFFLSSLFILSLICLSTQTIEAQNKPVMKTISGVVKTSDGEGLPGAVVNLEGTVYAAVTNIDGAFKLDIPALTTNSARIVVTMLGMETLTIPYEGKSSFNLTMKENVLELEEVVVNGYQKLDRRDMVGAHTSIKAEDILLPNYTSIDEMLQGQVAGLIVTNTSTRAGASPKMTLRGTSTLLGTTSPLWVVDGIIQQDVQSFSNKSPMLTSENDNDLSQLIGNSISWLNPNDIESIVVLKDASATAIYGSRASNGVIVITTKKGTRSGFSVNYRTNMSVNVRPTYDNYYLMNSKERINFSKEAYEAGAYYQRTPYPQIYTYEGLMRLYLDRSISEDDFIKQYNYLETVNTDWLDILTRTTVNHQHNLNISGGGEKTNYNVSVNYQKNNGIEIGNDQEKYSARLRLGFELTPRLKFDMSLVGTINETKGFSSGVNPQSYAINTSRAVSAYDANGDYAYYKKYSTYGYNVDTKEYGLKYNILNEIENSYTKISSPQLNATFNVDWDILGNDMLKYSFVGGYTNYTRNVEAYADEKTFYIAENFRGYDYGTVDPDPNNEDFNAAMVRFGGALLKETTTSTSYNIQNKLLFHKTFNKKHRVNGMAAVEVRSNTSRKSGNTIYGYMKSKNGLIVTPPAPNQVTPKGSSKNDESLGILQDIYDNFKIEEEIDNYISVFTSWAYAYDSKYIFNFNLRNDFTNRFGQDVNKRFDPSYSLGASWWVTEEKFMDVVKPYISSLALKVTYGIQGNVLSNVSPQLILANPELPSEYNQFTSTINRLPNPLLDWERTKSWNWGINLGLFDNKIKLDIDGYLRNSKPLSYYPLTPEYGITSLPQNGSAIRNSGIEITASFAPIKKKDMNLNMSVNFSKNWNAVKTTSQDRLQTITTNSYLNGNSSNDNKGVLLEKDYPVNGFWVYAFDQLNPETGYPMFKHMDMTDYNSISDFLTYAGSKEPLMSAGINLNFNYKNVSVSTGLAATLGGKTLLPDPYANFISSTLPTPETNLNKELVNRWRNPGDEKFTTIPSVYSGGISYTIKDPSGFNNNMYTMWAKSDDRLVSKSFLRCRQIAVSWHLPQKMLQPIGVKSLSLTGSVNNIFVIASSKYKGMDPETMTSIMPKSAALSLNVSF